MIEEEEHSLNKDRSAWIAIVTWAATILAVIAMLVSLYFVLECRFEAASVKPLSTDQMLAALGVTVTVLAGIIGVGAIIVGLIAVFGYRALADEVIKKAVNVAGKAAANVSLESLSKRAEEAARQVAIREVHEHQKSFTDMEIGNRIAQAESISGPPASNEIKPIAEPYPGEEAPNG